MTRVRLAVPIQLYPYVFATGDLAEWNALSHAECVYCASVRSGVEQAVAGGAMDSDGMVEVLEVNSAETIPGKWWLVETRMSQSSGSAPDAEKLYDIAIVVVREGDKWLVRGVEPHRLS